MQRDEQVGVVAARDVHPLAQRNVDVGVARQMHGVAALFEHARRAGCASSSTRSFSIEPSTPMVPESMPPWPASITTIFLPCGASAPVCAFGRRDGGQRLGRGFLGAQVGGPAGRALELRLRGREQIEHHAIAVAVRRRQDHRLGRAHRRVEIDHETRIAGAEQAVAIALHHALAGGLRPRSEPPQHFGHVDARRGWDWRA